MFVYFFIVSFISKTILYNFKPGINNNHITNKIDFDNYDNFTLQDLYPNNYISKMNYKKTITMSKFFTNTKKLEIVNNNNNNNNNNKYPIIYNTNKNQKYIFTSINIENIASFVKKNINVLNFKNESLYLINKKIKVFIHLEQLFTNTNIYHIGVTFNSIYSSVRYDMHGINYDLLLNYFPINKDGLYIKKIFWGYSDKKISEIIDYEKKLEHTYILGINDCRHYVRNLTTWACNKPTPIWKLVRNLID
tara:strand:- start:391 stop:1137 length:747 start_codon:yes stop_codon:yes gene_type:complete